MISAVILGFGIGAVISHFVNQRRMDESHDIALYLKRHYR